MFINNQKNQQGGKQKIVDKLNIEKNPKININYFYISVNNNSNSNQNNKNTKVQIELNNLNKTNLDITLPIKDEIFCCKIEKQISTFQETSQFLIKVSILSIISYIMYTSTDFFSDIYNQVVPEIKTYFYELKFHLKERNGIIGRLLNNFFIFVEHISFFIFEKCSSDEIISLFLLLVISFVFYNCCMNSKKTLISHCTKEIT